MSVKLQDPRTKPPVGAQIDWSHPLAFGLTACYLVNDTSGVVRNLAHQQGDLTVRSNARWVLQGLHSGTNVTNNNGAIVTTPTHILTKYQSLHWRGIPLGAHSSFANLLSVSYNNTDTTPWNYNSILRDGNNGPEYVIFAGNSGGTPGGQGAHHVNMSSFYGRSISLTLTRGPAAFRGYFNNNLVRNDSPLADPTVTATSLISLGAHEYVSSRYSNTISELGLIYDRALTHSEIAWLNEEPYGFIASPSRVTIIDLAPAAGGAVDLTGVAATASKAVLHKVPTS